MVVSIRLDWRGALKMQGLRTCTRLQCTTHTQAPSRSRRSVSYPILRNARFSSTTSSMDQHPETANVVASGQDTTTDPDFVPRGTFPMPSTMPKSYYLGHHAAGLRAMRKMTSNVNLIVECRDYRIPLSSRNPLLERALAEVPRIIVYTHADLGRAGSGADRRREALLRKHESALGVHFVSNARSRSRWLQEQHRAEIGALYRALRAYTTATFDMTGKNALVTGIPNVGKSTLLNALRSQFAQSGTAARKPSRKKAATTGGQPGVTRRIGTAVKIIEGNDAGSSALYVLDTPGVFMPYVPNAETFLKLALCGCVKETLVPPLVLADYLLYRFNLSDPSVYTTHTAQPPSNDIAAVLKAISDRTGRGLVKLKATSHEGASFEDPLDEIYGLRARVPGARVNVDYDAVASWMVQQWRAGKFGPLVLDEVTPAALEAVQRDPEDVVEISQSKALRMHKESRAEAARERKRFT